MSGAVLSSLCVSAGVNSARGRNWGLEKLNEGPTSKREAKI